jgi:hypothetical protein
LEVGLHGIQSSYGWDVDEWADYFFYALSELPEDDLRSIACVHQSDDRLLIELDSAIETARAGRPTDRGDKIAFTRRDDQFLFTWGVYEWQSAFITCCYAVWENASMFIEHFYKKFDNTRYDVLLTELLAIAERVASYEGADTGDDRKRFEQLAEQAHAAHIRAWNTTLRTKAAA